MKEVFILRAVSGSGKSTVAKILSQQEGWITCCNDDYFETPEGYVWDETKMGEAHEACVKKFVWAIHNPEIKGIVVSNTNVSKRQFGFYQEVAEKMGARVHFLVLENRHGNENIHGVPEETLQRQEANIKSTLRLRA